MSRNQDSISTKKAMLVVADGVIGAAVLLVLGVCLGRYLDHKLGSAPWLTLILCLIGGGGGLSRLMIKAINLNKDQID